MKEIQSIVQEMKAKNLQLVKDLSSTDGTMYVLPSDQVQKSAGSQT